MSELSIEPMFIKTDDDAWEALTQALADEIDDNVNLVFEGWPVLKITLEGEDFHSTMPTRIMPPILDLQKEIYHIYCRAKYNDESTRRLTDEERKQLELVVQVKTGSSEFITDFSNALNDIIRNSNMTGKQVTLLLITISVLFTGHFAWKDWLQRKEHEHNLEVSVKLSKEETQRLQIVTQAMQQNSEIMKTRIAIDEIRTEFAKKLQPNDQLKVSQEKIVNGHHAAKIVSAPRQLSEDIRLDGDYVINEVKFPKTFGEEYRFNVTRIRDNKTLNVNVSPTKITDHQLAILKDGGFGVKKTRMAINAKSSRGNITKANLVSISWPDDLSFN